MSKKENYTIIGNLSLSSDYVASGFSDSAYITFKDPLNTTPSLSSFEFVTALMPYAAGSTNLGVLDTSETTGSVGVRLTYKENKLRLRISSGGSTSYSVDFTGSTSLSLNTKYWCKISYSSSQGYKLFISTNGSDWNMIGSSTSTSRPYVSSARTSYLLGDNADTGGSFEGSIYLRETYFVVNGEKVWEAVEEVPPSAGSVEVGQGYCNVDGTNKIIFSNNVKKNLENIGGTKGFKNNVVLTLDNSDASSFVLQGVEAGNPTGYKATKALDKFVYLNNNKDMILGDSPKGGLDVSLPLDVNPVGGLKISDGVASNFSTTNYINTGKIFNFHDSDSWEIGYICILNNASKVNYVFGPAFFVQDFVFPLGFPEGGRWHMLVSSTGTSWDIFNKYGGSAENNKKYWVKYGYNGSSYYLRYSLDGVNYITGIEHTSSAKSVTNTSVVAGIGINAFSSDPTPWTNNFIDGSIDLKETYVRIGTNVWTPLVKSAINVSKGYAYSDETNGYLDVESSSSFALQEAVIHPEAFSISSYKPDYVINGTPTISEDYLASRFSSASYLKLPLDFKPEDKSWSITLKVKTPTSLSRRNLLFGTIDGFYYSTCAELSSDFRFGSGFTSNGSTWNIGWLSTSVVSSNTWYYLRLSFTGTSYKLELSLDGEHWNLENSIQSSTKLYQSGTHYLQIGTQANNSDYYEGTVDLKECKIVVDGKTIWTGAESIKDGYVSLINPQGTTKAVVTGMRNPTKDYTGSIATPADIAKKLSLTSDLSEIVAIEDI